MNNPPESAIASPDELAAAAAATRRWLERSVIGLGLCPFARAVVDAGSLRVRVSGHTTPEGLIGDLRAELLALQAARPGDCETTLLVHPWTLQDFLDFNDFQDACGALLVELDLEGVVQIAAFHPQFQFADSEPDDVANCTNRSPFPTLHLLRESSVAAVVDSGVDTDAIYRRNITTLRTLGAEGWRKLWSD